MNFTGLAKKRCSIRSYQDKAIEPEKLQAILEAGRLAPTGKNHQPQRLLVVQSAEGLEKVAKAMCNANAYTAKTVIIACADVDDCWIRSFDGHRIEEIDLSIVTTYMMMEATEQGLGSLWVERFDPEIVREEFHLPENYVPVSMLCLGYANPEAVKSPDRSCRKTLHHLFRRCAGMCAHPANRRTRACRSCGRGSADSAACAV